ncbi:MAG TPA: DUF2000 domain-containing protein [Desulfobacteraceae bacterium]|nr:DUF2000 domain-containing protein [Desulfobacteraceae bacterium]|tara:strand:- start:841 stop:1242 length:402 start_codon:yes stop_codon:yes gene_type:complete
MKTVMIVNQSLPPGLAANTTAVLGISLGRMDSSILGPDLKDGSGTRHPGITQQTIPVLSAESYLIKEIFEQSGRLPEISVIDFNTIAQKSRHYDDYTEKLAAVSTRDLEFSGICLQGPKNQVNKMTGMLKLYR